VDFLAGTVTMAHLVAAAFFFRFWRRTHDSLFACFGAAFLLFTANQILVSWLGADNDRVGYTYILRVLGFGMILYAIVGKNLKSPPTPGRRSRSS
jgi:hypothetical protein